MTKAKVVFLHGSNQKTVDLITSCAPDGFTRYCQVNPLSDTISGWHHFTVVTGFLPRLSVMPYGCTTDSP